MPAQKKHIVWVLSNSSSAPYFNWFAKIASVRRDFELSFVCLLDKEPAMIEDMNKFGFPCYWIPYKTDNKKLELTAAFFRLIKLFRKIKPDVVHTHLFDDSLPGILAARFLNIPERIVTKGDASFHYFHTPRWSWLDRILNKAATDIIALSEESKIFILEKEHASPEKVKVVHHGLDIKEVTAQREEYHSAFINKWNLKDRFVIGSVARFIKWKGFDDIIQVAEKVIKVKPDALFLFCGDGPEINSILHRIKELHLENNIILTGKISPEHMPSFYGIMDVFLHAARHEPFGLVIAEAMLNGVPVVSTPTGAAGDAITSGKQGFLCEYGNIHLMADRILLLADKDLRSEIGRNARLKAEELFSSERMYSDHLRLYGLSVK
ncbi:MAG: hypothetical protein Fur0041_03220 [Bacteroidia bacterium]